MQSRSGYLYTNGVRQHSLGYRPDVAAAVQNLLVSTKQIQESLQRWGAHQASEDQVSDCYVQFGAQFNATVEAFTYYNIDTSDISQVPSRLRNVLEDCLGEDPSPQALAEYMPDVRQLLYDLLQGIRAKQAAWRTASGRSGSSTVSSDSY
ncbi:hypothetical protein SERLA73DRAFT_191857 [Serpula lacrymans var. lacrymans S7.3]|uniref:Aip3p/Bud6 N-terminal domain-containing protein n=2 Tax=Serpula lacrymans var. lacrymans TaxID=341189 RepID=F8QIG7_SERL3|nr:uncharacterized protein SERLADRAFT_477107 [Serpula lacrymans var. lacrymans S7.9]EGN91892.1 hypothetical protein SERLA73DRAFT_191857 [Serpula lacrymans var. lacrymans S7.3]EGO20692.1 hypothetical protein SERLADRAFT_477107 [Serpula lacrymans var. lacrymans S7.9]